MTEDLSRRRMLRLMLGTGAAVAAGGLTVARSLAATGAGAYRTTSALNLRTGAGANYQVLLVVPNGAIVNDFDGQIANGYRSVDYNGTVGWVANAYLTRVGDNPSHPVIVGEKRTTAAVNLRSGPGTGHRPLRLVPAGAWVNVSNTVQNGFRYVTYQGQGGWISDQFLSNGGNPKPEIVGTAVTTAAVNLRSGPSSGHRVIQVVAKGATVGISNVVQNGYRYIEQHSGPAGWVADAYLGSGGQPAEYFTTTARLNLRAEPSQTARVLTVMPSGARVRAGNGRAPGFRQVTYNGITGWAATAYLN